MYKIYALIDPNTQLVRYIGVTTRLLSDRLSGHVCEGKNRTGTHKIYWIKQLLLEGKKPIIKLIEETDNWEERERYWIGYYDNLTNTREGGTGIVVNRSSSSIQRSAAKHERAIVQLDLKCKLVNTFDSLRKAAKATGVSRTNIGNVLGGRSGTAGGYHWMYRSGYKVALKERYGNTI